MASVMTVTYCSILSDNEESLGAAHWAHNVTMLIQRLRNVECAADKKFCIPSIKNRKNYGTLIIINMYQYKYFIKIVCRLEI